MDILRAQLRIEGCVDLPPNNATHQEERCTVQMLYVNRKYTIVEGMSRPQSLVAWLELHASHVFPQKEIAYRDRLSWVELF